MSTNILIANASAVELVAEQILEVWLNVFFVEPLKVHSKLASTFFRSHLAVAIGLSSLKDYSVMPAKIVLDQLLNNKPWQITHFRYYA